MSIDRRQTARGSVYDVRLRTPDGRAYKRAFPTRKEAETFQATEIANQSRGEWVDPRAGKITVEAFATTWIAERPDLRPRTRDLYEWLLRKHVLPHLGSKLVGNLRPSDPDTLADTATDQGTNRSGRRESNSRSQLGKLMFCR